MRCGLLAEELARGEGRFQIVAQAMTVGELLDAARLDPAIALISSDLQDGPLTGFRALRQLHASHPGVRSIMLLDVCEREAVIAAFRGGARGVFSRAGSLDDLTKCIERVHQGQIWACSNELQFLIEALSTVAPLRGTSPNPPVALSRREQQLATMVAAGLTDVEICRRLNVSEDAIKTHLARVCEKLGVQSRVELALCVVGRLDSSSQGQSAA